MAYREKRSRLFALEPLRHGPQQCGYSESLVGPAQLHRASKSPVPERVRRETSRRSNRLRTHHERKKNPCHQSFPEVNQSFRKPDPVHGLKFGGGKRDRTVDLLNAIQALSSNMLKPTYCLVQRVVVRIFAHRWQSRVPPCPFTLVSCSVAPWGRLYLPLIKRVNPLQAK